MCRSWAEKRLHAYRILGALWWLLENKFARTAFIPVKTTCIHHHCSNTIASGTDVPWRSLDSRHTELVVFFGQKYKCYLSFGYSKYSMKGLWIFTRWGYISKNILLNHNTIVKKICRNLYCKISKVAMQYRGNRSLLRQQHVHQTCLLYQYLKKFDDGGVVVYCFSGNTLPHPFPIKVCSIVWALITLHAVVVVVVLIELVLLSVR